MFVNEVNDVKIFNLSAGKSVPDWLTDRRRRSQVFKKTDLRRQIDLIQEFDMPGVCTSMRMSPDQQFILATGTYKPRIKCFEVSNLSIKFERCFDSEVTTFEVISDDYSKMIFLQCDRYVEMHAAHGRHYRLRIPCFGRDMKYHKPSCDMYIVGVDRNVLRLNLERGQFVQPYETEGSCLNVCEVNPEHHLLVVGTKEGTVEAWDPRAKERCSTLDVAVRFPDVKAFPSITALKYRNGLHMGVATASGHVLIYDIRARQPLLVKNHLNQMPIKRLAFNASQSAVYSLDGATLKIWHEQTGQQIAYIESSTSFNDFCIIPETGMLFLAQEDVKMLTYYIPNMGPAPRWCSFLDNLTEEIESEVVENVYDNYQFVTQKNIVELGLEHLIGTNLIKGYMHGFFMDVRLYNKAKAALEPFAFDRFRKEKVRQDIESHRKSRLQVKTKLPNVNQELALKIIDNQANSSIQRNFPSLLHDTRFKAIFENSDFAINKDAEEYRLLAPVLNRLDKSKAKDIRHSVLVQGVAEIHAEEAKNNANSGDEDLFGLDQQSASTNSDEASIDDEERREYFSQLKDAHHNLRQQDEENCHQDDINLWDPNNQKTYTKNLNNTYAGTNNKIIKLSSQDNYQTTSGFQRPVTQASLQDRLNAFSFDTQATSVGSLGNLQMSFKVNNKKRSQNLTKNSKDLNRDERKGIVRPIKSLQLKKVNFK